VELVVSEVSVVGRAGREIYLEVALEELFTIGFGEWDGVADFRA
jgi:hypothetical protein